MANLEVNLAGNILKNPLIAASGTFGFGKEFENFFPLSKLGAISTKGLTLEKREGNQPPRIAETPKGMLNSVGLENPGIEFFLENILPWLSKKEVKIIVNICGNEISDYCKLAEKLSCPEVDFIELNISCPNVKQGGMGFGCSANSTFKIVSEVRKKTTKPLIVKLSPNVTSIEEIAKAAQEAGADLISLINTVLGMRIDIKSRRPILKNNVGGLSGPAIFPIAVRMVWQVFKSVKIPIIGGGGISCFEDALELIIAGASAFSVGTNFFTSPLNSVKIVDNIKNFMNENNIDNISDIIGSVNQW